jgi:Type IV pili methyl-accepting chemotaxis transducer N-term
MKQLFFSVFLVVAFLGSLTWSQPVTAQSVATMNVVATSGKQRMLSQRAVKAYAQLALAIAPEKSSAILTATIGELKSNNSTLLTVAKEANLTALQAQSGLIERLSMVLTQPTSPSTILQAAKISEELLNNAEAVTQGFIKSGAEAQAALVNLAARQRMLSQRAAGSYLLYQTAAKSPELKARAAKATEDFKAAISAFDDAKEEFPQIADRIDMARIQMIFFENALSNIDNPTKEQFVTIATTSERILGEMDSMTSEIVKHLAARNAPGMPGLAKKK